MLKQQQERILVGRLFKELIVLVNNHASTPSEPIEIAKSGPILKHPTLNKRKSKLTKLPKETIEPDDAKSQTHELVELKNNKKHSTKYQRKQLMRQEQERAKQLIFSDYQKVMSYRVHEEEHYGEKQSHSGVQGGDIGQRSKKNFSIMQNITITINPNAKQ